MAFKDQTRYKMPFPHDGYINGFIVKIRHSALGSLGSNCDRNWFGCRPVDRRPHYGNCRLVFRTFKTPSTVSKLDVP